MSRLQKKCLVASLVMHCLLIGILVIGPAFTPSRPPPANDLPILDFIPSKLVDEMMYGGGAVGPPPPQTTPKKAEPKPAAATPLVAKAPEPKPASKTVKPANKTPDPVEDEPVRTKKKSKPSAEEDDSLDPLEASSRQPITKFLKKVVRAADRDNASAKAEAAAADARRREAALAAQRELVDGVMGALRKGLSGSTAIGPFGVNGTGGPSYGNYNQTLIGIYYRAWYDPPSKDVADSLLSVEADVVIARSGKILEWRITRASGNAAMDRSVRRVLERVKTVPPLPESATENERTVPLLFNLKARRLLE